MKRIFNYTFAVFLTVLFASCTHKELCFDHSHIVDLKVVIDWSHAPEASPATMSLYMYPVDGGEGFRFEFPDRKGGTIRIPIGEYRGFCINSDTEVIRYRNTDAFDTFELITRPTTSVMGLFNLGLTTSSTAPRAEGTEDEQVAFSPDPVWSDRVEGIVLTELNAPQTITLYPESAVCNYSVEIRNAENLKYVSGVGGSLSGLTEGYLPGIDGLGPDRVTVPFDADISLEDGLLTGAFRTFGHCYEMSIDHKLVIYAVMSDGNKRYYTFDVTDQVHNAPDQRNVHIIIDGLPLPKPITNGGGFHPEVDDWESIEIDITM